MKILLVGLMLLGSLSSFAGSKIICSTGQSASDERSINKEIKDLEELNDVKITHLSTSMAPSRSTNVNPVGKVCVAVEISPKN